MRISDWSSDVCSSDLARRDPSDHEESLAPQRGHRLDRRRRLFLFCRTQEGLSAATRREYFELRTRTGVSRPPRYRRCRKPLGLVRKRRGRCESHDRSEWRKQDDRGGDVLLVRGPGPLFCGAALYRVSRRIASQSRSSEEHTSELQSLLRILYAVFCLQKIKRSHVVQTHNNFH